MNILHSYTCRHLNLQALGAGEQVLSPFELPVFSLLPKVSVKIK
jgi:hypothetical protein